MMLRSQKQLSYTIGPFTEMSLNSMIAAAAEGDLGEKTRGQSSNPVWMKERSFRLTASHFGEVCKQRKSTNPFNLVLRILKSQFKGSSGASFDGIIDADMIIEVKCPYSANKYSPEDAVNKKKIKYVELNEEENKVKLKKNCNYYYQVQGQLAIANAKICYFIVWTPLGIAVEEIEQDDFWTNVMLPKLKSFYLDQMLPEIVEE
ncbi:unnamed protein product [Ceutorhynchus assimilis]|uniref:YqaJ viral recombinase domain-containing protein n=1 Tax=Ceutorhynchus assimilis TaxID=467358 RepID=A0A9N9MJ24_9CUCU|nr:unnamed protein product [Ceutorhynchus assimilis]